MLYAVLSLTLVRMVPVALAMVGSSARLPTIGFLGWFGPRGLASIVFAVIVVEQSHLPHESLIVHAVYVTVGLSVLAHGLTAAPLAERYARWFERHPHDRRPDGGRPAAVTRTAGCSVVARLLEQAVTARIRPSCRRRRVRIHIARRESGLAAGELAWAAAAACLRASRLASLRSLRSRSAFSRLSFANVVFFFALDANGSRFRVGFARRRDCGSSLLVERAPSSRSPPCRRP